jgi:thiamine biosynthesis lipoprotein
MKGKFLIIPLALLVLLLVFWQEEKDNAPTVFMQGKALGVAFSLQYTGDPQWEKSLDSIIYCLDKVVNLQRPDAEVSRFNRNGVLENYSPHLGRLLEVSSHYRQISGGLVSHSMLPLIEAWGRDFSKRNLVSEALVDSLKALVSTANIVVEDGTIKALRKGGSIDLNYLDKGYLIDLLASFLKSKGVNNFQIEFGLDGCAYGKVNPKQRTNFLLNIPEELKASLRGKGNLTVQNRCYSTSGSFEKFYLDEKGNKHSHLIDPITGYPLKNGILSTHILSNSALEADAMATIAMIQDIETSQLMIEGQESVEGVIVYHEDGLLKYWISTEFYK